MQHLDEYISRPACLASKGGERRRKKESTTLEKRREVFFSPLSHVISILGGFRSKAAPPSKERAPFAMPHAVWLIVERRVCHFVSVVVFSRVKAERDARKIGGL